MSDEPMTTDEERRRLAERAEPVPEADALEQAEEVEPDDDDEERAWLLLGDAGTPIGEFGNPPETWLVVLPLYAEMQRREAAHAHDHLAHGVPDLRVATLPARCDDLLRRELPLERGEWIGCG